MAVSERVLQERQEVARPQDAPIGPVWLKGQHQQVASLGLEKAFEPVRLHKGQDAPAGEAPSAVICYPSDEESLAAEVECALSLAPNSVILVFAPAPNLALARAALGAGASGLLHAGMSPEQILRAVSVALQGGKILPRCLLPQWLDERRTPDLAALLSGRQKEILELVGEGFTNAEIGWRLYLSESTIKQHLRAAYKLLGVHNRTEAANMMKNFARKY